MPAISYISSAALPGLNLPKTYAAWPVWRDSTPQPVTWQRMPKKAAVQLWHRARDFERRTRQPRRQDGALGRNGLAVLQTLIFDFLNYATGRLDPAIETLARKAGISERSAARGLAALKRAGVVNWIRRCVSSLEGGRLVRRQKSNAYAVVPASQWRGYNPPADPPAPAREAWGAAPRVPDAIAAAVIERRAGGDTAAVLRELDGDPTDRLTACLPRRHAAG